jgi:murein DD-endopeptidase MepM/ murein hydrolase activator NlpD
LQSQFLDMKKIFGLLLLLPFFALAQKDITHTVGPKESLTSIGRLYNINGRELANYNKIEYEKGLTLGQVLKIPGKNAAAKAAAVPVPAKIVTPAKTVVAKTEKGKPVYHTVGKKETLYHISTLYNKVPIDDIKKWNNLTSDALSEGAKLIVGYTGTKKEQPVKEDVVEIPKPKKEETPPQKNIEEVKTAAVVKEVKNEPAVQVKAVNFNGGIFKSLYESQTSNNNLVSETGTGGVFKSTSGWEDGKYYCLHNTAPAGTVIKITNVANGKSVYAKVLDLIPDIKQNTGLIIRLSNAAADALGSAENKLDCTLNYSK